MRRAATLLALVATASAAPAPAKERDRETLVRARGAKGLATYGGVTVLSVRRPGNRYALAVVRDGRLRRLAVDTLPEPFDADVGPDTRGRPTVVFSRDGDLFLHRLHTGRTEPIRTVGDGHQSQPSLWRGRIAWWGDEYVLTRNRLVSRAVPPQRVPGVPAATEDVEIEVRGRLIATSDLHGRPQPDIPNQYVRLHDLTADRSSSVWVNGAGIGGQTIVGLSFAGPWLGFHRSCFGDPGGCDTGGARRFHTESGRYEWWTGYRTLEGFALLPGGTLELTEDGRLQRLAAPRWEPIPPRAIRR